MALTFNDEQEAELLDLLGLPKADPGTTDVQVVLDTVADLAEQDGGTGTTPPAPGTGTPPSTMVATAQAAGLEVIDAEALAGLRADAAEGRRLIAEARQVTIEAAVDDAVRLGKITPARKAHWVQMIHHDPAMADFLAELPAETAVPMTELGHSSEPMAKAGDDDAWVF